MVGQNELTMEKDRPLEAVAGPAACRQVRILMAAGGTGGHIFPALAVADELRRRSGGLSQGVIQYQTVFLGTGRVLESRLIPRAGYPLEAIHAAGLKGISGWKRFLNASRLPRSAFEAAKLLYRLRPGAVVGIGGYVSGPVMLEASLLIALFLFGENR